MSYNLVDPTTGDLTQVAGRGRAEYGASTVRTGSVSVTDIPADGSKATHITFDTPMPDSDYEVFITVNNWIAQVTVSSVNKTASGFTVYIYNEYATPQNADITYKAFKLYSDVEYSNLVNSMPSNASASNKLITVADRASFTKTIHTTVKTQSDWHTLGSIDVSDIPTGNYLVSLQSSPAVQAQSVSSLLQVGGKQIAMSMVGGTTEMLSCPKVISKGSATTLAVLLYLGYAATIQEGDFVIRFDRVN